MTSPASDPWLLSIEPRPQARLRLFCLPNAGGGASVFHAWPKALRPEIEVLPVQLPGHETRLREPLHARVEPLVEALASALRPSLDRPFAFLGFSLGGLLAFELSRELRRRGAPAPSMLLAASKPAPDFRKAHPSVAQLPQAEFLACIRQVYAPPEEAWRVPELMELMLPVLRADMSLYDHYQYREEPPLACPIHVFGGESDLATPADGLEAWRRHTTAAFSVRRFPGGHFFLQQQPAPIRRAVERHLETLLAPDPRVR